MTAGKTANFPEGHDLPTCAKAIALKLPRIPCKPSWSCGAFGCLETAFTESMSNQLTQIKTLISSDAMQKQFAAALPKHLSPERFARIAITALTRTPKLAECTQESLFRCLLDLSAMGLEPDGRRAYLIPYGKDCTLIVSFMGLVELMRRAGDVSTIHADIVCENDQFEENIGEVTLHKIDRKKPRGEMFAAYCQVTFKDGSKQSAVMSKDEIESIRNRSKSGNAGPWKTDYNEMAKKTVVRRISKMITLSPEIHNAIEKTDRHEFGEMRIVTEKRISQQDTAANLMDLVSDDNEEGGAE